MDSPVSASRIPESPAGGDQQGVMIFSGMNRAESVARQLRGEILSGTLPPGAALRDAELARRFGVSITPIRESLAQLIAEGLVEVLPNKRRRVVTLTQRQSEDLMDVLAVLFGAAYHRLDQTNSAVLGAIAHAHGSFAEACSRALIPQVEEEFARMSSRLFASTHNAELDLLALNTLQRVAGVIRLYPSTHLFPLWADAFNDLAELLYAGQLDKAEDRSRRFFAELITSMSRERDANAIIDPTA